MFTQCPDCRKTYPLTKAQLRGKKTFIYCKDCSKKFNALELLSDKPTGLLVEAKAEFIAKPESTPSSSSKKKAKNRQPANKNPVIEAANNNSANETTPIPPTMSPTSERLPWEAEKTPVNVLWFVGVVIGSLILLGQIIYFESARAGQNAAYRPQLEKLCNWLGCQLADYENLAELTVLQGSFTPNADNTISFKAVINNQAAFKQHLPNIKLTLLDYNEQLFAQRIFAPKEYLPATASTSFSIAPDETVTASLTIAAPKTSIGGYNFDLTY